MRLDRAWIEGHIPHKGRMCLLEDVIGWDAERISCRSGTHRAADHPLRAHGRLGIACGIEYAAQAMAVHGALVAGALDNGLIAVADAGDASAPRVPGVYAPIAAAAAALAPAAAAPAAGFLASVRGVRLHVLRLDDVLSDLFCNAVRVAGNRVTALYEFEVRSRAACLLEGRATVVFDANEGLNFR
jgi:predicted hotdog family 3-hydroxylacyl-ACP dehydratase